MNASSLPRSLRNGLFALLFVTPFIGFGQINPDLIGDRYGVIAHGSCVLRQEQGQSLGTDHQPVVGLKFYYENSPVGIWLKKNRTVSYTIAVQHNDSTTTDTLSRIDMTFGRGVAQDPVAVGSAVPGTSNYYIGHTATEGVPAYAKTVYREAWPYTNVYFYGSSSGPRMSFVVMPGGDPSAISLNFNGHDSLKVDLDGALKLYIGEKFIKLEEAVAYQINNSNIVLPLAWEASYDHDEGLSYVTFHFEDYDPELPLVFQVGYPPAPPPPPTDYRNLEWCTYTSGDDNDELKSIELDNNGDPYVCGYSKGQFYPISVGNIYFAPNSIDAPGYHCAVVSKFNHSNKQIYWATYYGGATGITSQANTEAHKLAVYNGLLTGYEYVFVTGSTTCTDFEARADDQSIFVNANQVSYLGGNVRSWVGAFKKLDGTCHWATTHGQASSEYTWGEHGLAIDVDNDGQLVVAGMISAYFSNVIPDFQNVTPSGAFDRELGDGFFLVFSSAYDIQWASAFCEFSGAAAYGRINDIRLRRTNDDHTTFWMVGASVEGSGDPLDLVPPPTGQYFQSSAGDLSAVIAVVDITGRSLDYCTRWGSPTSGAASAAYGIEIDKTNVYIAGYTEAFDLDASQLPFPSGSGPVFYSTTNNSNTVGQFSQGFIIRFDFNTEEYLLDYGTLVGGNRADVILDVTSDQYGHIYFTGETRSQYGFAQDISSNLYYQPQYNYTNRRDAFILGLDDLPRPTAFWRTAFGGEMSERGWGIAANTAEVYICGATASSESMWNDQFPLVEFDTSSDLDWYWDIFLGGGSISHMVPYIAFNEMLDYEQNNIDVFVESYGLPCDGYIASFDMADLPIGILEDENNTTKPRLRVWRSDVSTWSLEFPYDAKWSVALYNASGAHIGSYQILGSKGVLDVRPVAHGVYLLRAIDFDGSTYSAKISVQ